MSYTLRVDPSRCIDCGACVRECARHLPVYRNGRHASTSDTGDRHGSGADDRGGNGAGALECIGCFHCFAVCPQGAVTLEGPELAAPLPGGDGGNGDGGGGGGSARIAPEALRALLAMRRSCRRFEDRPLEPELLEELVRTAAFIPSGGNSHGHRFTIITHGDRRRALEGELRRIYRGRRALLGNPILRALGLLVSDPQTRAFLRDRTYFTRVSYLLDQMARGEDPIFYGAPAVVLVHSRQPIPTPREDSVLAAYNLVLAAETLGLGSCFVSLAQNAVNQSRACKRILGMDPREQVHAVVVLGHPAVRFHRAAPRQPMPIAWLQ